VWSSLCAWGRGQSIFQNRPRAPKARSGDGTPACWCSAARRQSPQPPLSGDEPEPSQPFGGWLAGGSASRSFSHLTGQRPSTGSLLMA